MSTKGRVIWKRRGLAPAFQAAVRHSIQFAARTARLMVGIPDYQTYVSRRQALHRDAVVMSYREFFRDRQQARYDVKKGGYVGIC